MAECTAGICDPSYLLKKRIGSFSILCYDLNYEFRGLGKRTTRRSMSKSKVVSIAVRTKVRAGGLAANHNQVVVPGRTKVRRGGHNLNHNEVVVLAKFA